MQYGHFDDQKREYVITRPDTPLPWINYLGCEDFFGIISNTSGGYSFYRDARLRRLTRYRYNNCPVDSNGRYIYVRDGDDVWNPGWKPTQTELDHYECRHGLGYTSITGHRNDIEVAVTTFVPVGKHLEVWDVTVTNHSGTDRALTLFGSVEWCLWDAMDDMTNFQRNFSTGEVEVEDGVIFHKTEYRERRNHFAFFDCTAPVVGFDTSRDAFVGVHNGFDRPHAVRVGQCTNSVAHGWSPIGALQVDLSVAAGASTRFQFRLGYCENREETKFTSPGVINKAPYREAVGDMDGDEAVDREMAALAQYWDERLSAYTVQTGNEHADRTVNIWNAYQCMVTFNLSRSASGYESGIGRGMGFRDSNQDVLGMVHMESARVRERLCDLAATQLSDGSCFHQYQPLTKQGNSDIGSGFNDDPLWLVLAVCAYIRETGDVGILEETVGYADAPQCGATLGDHLDLSVRHTDERLGPHGLPLIGHADWNDCLNLNCFSTTPGESFQLVGDIEDSAAESLMIAGQYCAACGELERLYRHLERDEEAESLARRRAAMHDAVDAHGWDGAWFLRAYDANGNAVGSSSCEEGQIFIESQGWCIMGGIGVDDGKAREALKSTAERLATERGIILQQPAYSRYYPELGEVSSYPPGYKENAGIFAHNNTWIQIAEALAGNGRKAWEYNRSICPSLQDDHDRYRAEPYIYPQMIAGPDAPSFGEAKNSWLTGTAAWSYVAMTQYILGVRASHEGLVIDPCIPPYWSGFRVTRRFRGKSYEITVRNPHAVSRGVERMTVGGRLVKGHTVPLDADGDPVRVEIVLGNEK